MKATTFKRQNLKELSKIGRKLFFILGASDTGKTTLALELANFWLGKGKSVAIVDADIGQSTFGPPVTVGFALLKKPVADLKKVKPEGLYFVGDVTPRGHFLEVVTGTKKMLEEALRWRPQKIIVDSGGLVAPLYGEALKFYKIDLLKPDVIVALEREYELEHILHSLENFKGFKIKRLSVPPKVAVTTRNKRRLLREDGYLRYFKSSRTLNLKFEDLAFYPASLNLAKTDILDVLVGLRSDKGKVLGVGIVRGFNFPVSIRVFTPVKSGNSIKELEIGTLKIDSNFKEKGRIFNYFY